MQRSLVFFKDYFLFSAVVQTIPELTIIFKVLYIKPDISKHYKGGRGELAYGCLVGC